MPLMLLLFLSYQQYVSRYRTVFSVWRCLADDTVSLQSKTHVIRSTKQHNYSLVMFVCLFKTLTLLPLQSHDVCCLLNMRCIRIFTARFALSSKAKGFKLVGEQMWSANVMKVCFYYLVCFNVFSMETLGWWWWHQRKKYSSVPPLCYSVVAMGKEGQSYRV